MNAETGKSSITIREAEKRDLPALLAIYNDEVCHGVATLDLHPRTMEQWEGWYATHRENPRHPLFLAERDGVVVGYASLSPYRDKEAYITTAELSVYIQKDHRGKGVATVLLNHLLNFAKAQKKIRTVVSVITEGNAASRRLHEAFGFIYCGTIPAVGVKFGQLLSIENYALQLCEVENR